MEAVVQTTSQEEIEEAVSAGGDAISIISVVGKTVEEAMDLRQHIPDEVRKKGISMSFSSFVEST